MATSDAKLWSHAVTHRPPATFPPRDLYTKDAKTIYLEMRKPHVSPNGLGSAIQMVQFFINRAGRNLPETRKNVLRKAIELLQIELRYLRQVEQFDLKKQPKPVHPPPNQKVGGRFGFNRPPNHSKLDRSI